MYYHVIFSGNANNQNVKTYCLDFDHGYTRLCAVWLQLDLLWHYICLTLHFPSLRLVFDWHEITKKRLSYNSQFECPGLCALLFLPWHGAGDWPKCLLGGWGSFFTFILGFLCSVAFPHQETSGNSGRHGLTRSSAIKFDSTSGLSSGFTYTLVGVVFRTL